MCHVFPASRDEEGNMVDCYWYDPMPGPGGPSPPAPAPPEPERRIGPPSGGQFDGFDEAYDALAKKPDCAALIAGATGATATTLQTHLWNANVTVGTAQPGNGNVTVTGTRGMDYEYEYQTAYTSGGNIELNGNYFPDPTQLNIDLLSILAQADR